MHYVIGGPFLNNILLYYFKNMFKIYLFLNLVTTINR